MSRADSHVVSKIEEEFCKKTILVIGDLMVDQYIVGRVSRISPEAPVPILKFSNKILEVGGACNVAHNLKSLGCNVLIAGVAADDEAGTWLKNHLAGANIDTKCVIAEEGRPTTLKVRYATKGQQLLRVDYEKTDEILDETKHKILDFIAMYSDRIDGVIMSDYRKGVLNSERFIKEVVDLCRRYRIMTSIDSKSRDISAFENIDIVKPNNIELENAVNVKINDDDSLNKAGELYLARSKARILLVTKGARGISVFVKGERRADYPAAEVQVYDVTGAGDTVISTTLMAVLSGMTIGEAAKLANVAAGIVISKVGTAAVTRDELIERIRNEKSS